MAQLYTDIIMFIWRKINIHNTGVCEKYVPPGEKTGGKASFQNTKPGAGEHKKR